MKKKTYLGTTKNGYEIVYDEKHSHASTHFKDEPKLLSVVKRVIPVLELEGDELRIEFDTGNTVGETGLVETDDEDEIVYAMRVKRNRYSRFVKGKASQPSSWIVLAFEKIGKKKYELYTAFVGRLTPSFPGGNFMPEKSVAFWSNHALVWGTQDIIPGTETEVCPW